MNHQNVSVWSASPISSNRNDVSPRGLPGCLSDRSNCAVFSVAINPAEPAMIYGRSDAGNYSRSNIHWRFRHL